MFEKDPIWQRLFKYALLLSIKESYLLLRNILGLWWHPAKTISVIFREKDRSQAVLVLGLPIWVLLGGLFALWLVRRVVNATPGVWGLPTYLSLAVVFITGALLSLYLGYWFIKVRKIKHHIFEI